MAELPTAATLFARRLLAKTNEDVDRWKLLDSSSEESPSCAFPTLGAPRVASG